jgi:SAM-dependent methyltransferase
LAKLYDFFDGERSDLGHYLDILKELNSSKVLDIGCGTGCFANILVENGYCVVGVDPAAASLEVAKEKMFSEKIDWICGDISSVGKSTSFDTAIMTGNVAQVFLDDNYWKKVLTEIYERLRPDGFLIFEVRNPERKAWHEWNKVNTYQKVNVPDIGIVEEWCDVTEVIDDLVSFRWTYIFESDGAQIISDSTLKFREKEQIIESLEKVGYTICDIRDAPDRPSKELVFIVQKKY